jgi:Eukaryotic glutathione synthase, ATP binding domain
MELIHPPGGVQNLLFRPGGSAVVRKEVVGELGIFGWSLFGGDAGVLKHEEAGWLVRTKGKESDDGGVAVGFSVWIPYSWWIKGEDQYIQGGLQIVLDRHRKTVYVWVDNLWGFSSVSRCIGSL